MKRHLKIIYIFILPICLVVFSLMLRDSKGPYFLNVHYDPGYVYFVNSLNLAQLNDYGVGFIDHPGIPLQVFGAVVLKTFHNNNSDLALDVLSRPDFYMNCINSSLIFLNAFTLLLFGWFVYKIFNSIILSVFFQLTPFSSFNTFYELSDVSAENFLLMFYILMILISFKYLESLKNSNKSNDILYLFGFSLITGIGIATKLNFFPFVIIPLVLFGKLRFKISYLITSFIFFLLFVSPGFKSISGFMNWIERILFNDGLYSSGNSEIIGSPDFLTSLINIFSEDIFFAIVYFSIVVFITINVFIIPSHRKNIAGNLKRFYENNKFLTAIFIIMNVEFFFLLKKFSQHYIFPGLVISITAVFLLIQLLYKDYPDLSKKISKHSFYKSIILLIIIFQFFNYKSHFEKYTIERNEALKLNELIKNDFEDAVIISGYGSSNSEYALNYSTYWAGGQSQNYKQILSEQFPNNLFYEYWVKKIFAFSKSADIKSVLRSKSRIVFQTGKLNSVEDVVSDIRNEYGLNVMDYKKIRENSNGEKVYEIIISK